MSSFKPKKYQNLIAFVMLTVGCIIGAYALETILIPNTILDGGITGISIIISKLSGVSLSLLVLILNPCWSKSFIKQLSFEL